MLEAIDGNTLTFERADGSLYFLWVSPPPVIDAVLELADLQAGQTLYDLGSGDGRVLIRAVQKYPGRAVGIESHADLVACSRRKVEELGLEERVTIREADFNTVDLGPADAIVFFLDPQDLSGQLEARVRERLRAGARLITVNCPLPGRRPARRKVLRFSDSDYTIRLFKQKGSNDD